MLVKTVYVKKPRVRNSHIDLVSGKHPTGKVLQGTALTPVSEVSFLC